MEIEGVAGHCTPVPLARPKKLEISGSELVGSVKNSLRILPFQDVYSGLLFFSLLDTMSQVNFDRSITIVTLRRSSI